MFGNMNSAGRAVKSRSSAGRAVGNMNSAGRAVKSSVWKHEFSWEGGQVKCLET